MFQFEKTQDNPIYSDTRNEVTSVWDHRVERDNLYYCNFHVQNFLIGEYTVSGWTKIYSYQNDKESFIVLLNNEYTTITLGKFYSKYMAEIFLQACIESFNKQLLEHFQKKYLPGGSKYIESEKKIRELEN